MTDSVPGADAATPLSMTPAPAVPQADAPVAPPRSDRPHRGGRNRQPGAAAATLAQDAPRRAARPVPPALETLAELYPQLFGAHFLPLKRGIFQDLLAAHPEAFEREALKAALGIHTRSTRYLQAVAAGLQRHDLQGRPVEPMAPEHVHHALLETYRRRQGRGPEDQRAKLRARIARNFEASGLTREEYAERVRSRDEAANALLDEAFAELAERSARDEALLRAFEASGKSLEEFADMYGLDPRTVTRTLAGARQRRAVAAPAA